MVFLSPPGPSMQPATSALVGIWQQQRTELLGSAGCSRHWSHRHLCIGAFSQEFKFPYVPLTWLGLLTSGQLSQASPTPSPSLSCWSRLGTFWQLSRMFFIPTRKERFSESGEQRRQVWNTHFRGLQRSGPHRYVVSDFCLGHPQRATTFSAAIWR